VRLASYTIRFLCEVAAVVALVWWGWPWWGLLAGAAVIVFWGVFVAPKALRRLPDPWRFASELVIFGAATAGYWAVGQQTLAVVFAVLAVTTAALVRRWPEP
jgi:hypothetical protein